MHTAAQLNQLVLEARQAEKAVARRVRSTTWLCWAGAPVAIALVGGAFEVSARVDGLWVLPFTAAAVLTAIVGWVGLYTFACMRYFRLLSIARMPDYWLAAVAALPHLPWTGMEQLQARLTEYGWVSVRGALDWAESVTADVARQARRDAARREPIGPGAAALLAIKHPQP